MVLALAACASSLDDDTSAYIARSRSRQVAPADYTRQLLEFMRSYLNDPTGVRNASIADPALMTIEGYDRYAVCLRYDARNLSGRYSGISDRLAIFTDGRFDRLIERAKDQCSRAAYRPFHELEQLRR